MFKLRLNTFLFAIALAFCGVSVSGLAQVRTAQPAKAEPLHTVSGVLRGKTIKIERPRWIEKGTPLMTVKLREARWEGNRLQLTGIAEGAGNVSFTLVGVTARSASPWPSASSDTARKKDAQDKGEKNEQTQSLHAAADMGAGCDILFLKMKPKAGGRELQAGVTMAGVDNPEGRDINQMICQIAKFTGTGDEVAGKVAELNRVLGRK